MSIRSGCGKKTLKIPRVRGAARSAVMTIQSPRTDSQTSGTSPKRNTLASGFPREGSFSIEAAFVIPLFLAAVLSFMIFFPAGIAEVRLKSAMENVGARLGNYYLAVEKLEEAEADGEDPGFLESALSAAVGSVLWSPVSETLVKGMVLKELGETWAGESLVEDGLEGITFFGSRYDKAQESIVLRASYRLKTPFSGILQLSLPVSVQTSHRVWSGKEMEGALEEEMVYVTRTGKVYHDSLSCTHLKLSIRDVPLSQVDKLRSEDGSKYYPCELCGNRKGTTVFITNYGNRYHVSRNCSGIRRDIRSIPISQAGDRGLCSRCKGRRKGQMWQSVS